MAAKPASFLWSEGAGIVTTLSRIQDVGSGALPTIGKNNCVCAERLNRKDAQAPTSRSAPATVAQAKRNALLRKLIAGLWRRLIGFMSSQPKFWPAGRTPSA